eukprot:jgi/Astpho2/7249/Aster-01557
MQHYQVPSAEYSSYINQVISLGLAEDYISQLRASCSPNRPPPLRAAIDQACRHLSGLVDGSPASAGLCPSSETWGQQNGAPVPEAAVGLAAAMLITPQEEARILQLNQLINARHAAAKPQNTAQAERSAAKLWKRYCEQMVSPDGDIMSQAKILEFSMWLVDEAVQQNGARYSFSSVGDYLCHLKEVRREQYTQGRITSDIPAPLEIQAVDAALGAGQLRQSLQTASQQKQWQWAHLLRLAMTFMPATLGRSDDLRKLPWSCLALRTQDNVGPVPSVAILFGSMQGNTVKPGQVNIPGVVRYRDHRICPQAALADLAVATFHRGIKLEDLAKFIVAAPSMQGNQRMSGETLKVRLRQTFELAGVPCGRLDGYSAKGEVSHNFKKHGVEAAKSVGINQAEIKMAARYATQAMLRISEQDCPQLSSVLPCRHESDTTDLYCIFDPDTAHRLAGWGRDWHENHRLGQAEFKAEEDVLDRIILGLTVLLRQAGMRCHPAHPLLAPLRAIDHLRQVFVQNASLRIDSYGNQWLRTIPPAASRLLQSAVGKQLRQETMDKHVAAEAVLSDRALFQTDPTAFLSKTLGGKGATPMPFAPVVMLPQVPLSASAKPIPLVPLASQASYGVTLLPQSLSALSASNERDSFLFEKQVWKLSELQTVPEALRHFPRSQRWHGSKKEAGASSTAFSRFKNGLAAEVKTRMAALGSTMAAVVGALDMERERIPATRTVRSLQQLCSRYSNDSKLLGKRKQSG